MQYWIQPNLQTFDDEYTWDVVNYRRQLAITDKRPPGTQWKHKRYCVSPVLTARFWRLVSAFDRLRFVGGHSESVISPCLFGVFWIWRVGITSFFSRTCIPSLRAISGFLSNASWAKWSLHNTGCVWWSGLNPSLLIAAVHAFLNFLFLGNL